MDGHSIGDGRNRAVGFQVAAKSKPGFEHDLPMAGDDNIRRRTVTWLIVSVTPPSEHS